MPAKILNMKKRTFCLLLFCLPVFVSVAQEPFWAMDTGKKYEVPLGVCTWEQLSQGKFYEEMMGYYNNYTPNAMNTGDLVKVMNMQFPEYQLNVTVYFGAWCGDSKEHVPAFIRYCEVLHDQYQFDVHYTLIGVDRAMKSGFAELDTANIQKVPTFIVYLTKMEGDRVVKTVPMGRIVETPEVNLEEDIYMMLTKLMKYGIR